LTGKLLLLLYLRDWRFDKDNKSHESVHTQQYLLLN
jgi:hypothetical protein